MLVDAETIVVTASLTLWLVIFHEVFSARETLDGAAERIAMRGVVSSHRNPLARSEGGGAMDGENQGGAIDQPWKLTAWDGKSDATRWSRARLDSDRPQCLIQWSLPICQDGLCLRFLTCASPWPIPNANFQLLAHHQSDWILALRWHQKRDITTRITVSPSALPSL